jgi:hypothetical protein
LYALLLAEMQVSELVHNFYARPVPKSTNTSKHNPTGDVNLDQVKQFHFFPNEWQLEYLQLLDAFGGSGSPEDSAETGLFGSVEFSGKNFTPGSFEEASNRLVYTAINTRKLASGNPNFGDITVVFKRTYVKDMALLFPLDSGIYEMGCNATGPHKHFNATFNCSALPNPTTTVGTLEHFNHMFLPFLYFWNSSWRVEEKVQVQEVPISAAHHLAAVVHRLLSPWSSMPNVTSQETMMYQEANILGTALLPTAVKFVVGDFPSLFGTQYGLKLQQWCSRMGTMLIWTLGPNQPPRKKGSHHDPSVPWSSNHRIVDPQVMNATNASSIVSTLDQEKFTGTWTAVFNRRAENKPIQVQEWKELWSLMPMDLSIEPLRAHLCSAPHECIGALVKDGGCVCYPKEIVYPKEEIAKEKVVQRKINDKGKDQNKSKNTGKFKNKEKKTIGNHNSVRQVSVTYNSADKTYSTTFGPFVKNAAAFGRFNNASNTSGWATLDINTNGGSNGLSSYYAAGLAEGVLTCHFVAAVSLNNGDVASKKNPGLLNYTLETIAWTRQQAASNSNDEFWNVIAQILAQFDGLVDGYKRSECSANQPLTALDLWFMNMDGDLEDLNNKFDQSAGVTGVTGVTGVGNGTAPALVRPQHCSSLVKWSADHSDLFFGHATWDIYSNAAPRIFKTYTLPVTSKGVTAQHRVTFSSTGPWLSSVDDFYVVSGHADLGITETSNTVLNANLYALVQPKSLLCWLRVIAANRLATDGKSWGHLFAKYHSGTYTNQWQIIDLNLFTPGATLLTSGVLTVVEEIPGLVHVGDQTKYLQTHGYWPSYNVPYYNDVRAANGNFNGSWSSAPRNKLFKLLQGSVTSISTMQQVMRWNNYRTTPTISGGNPCNAIACRADVRSTGTHPQSDFGAIDAKLSSYASLMDETNKKKKNTLTVFAEMGPSHDDQPMFCWSSSPVHPVPPHHLHPDCFGFGFETLVPTVLTAAAQEEGGDDELF